MRAIQPLPATDCPSRAQVFSDAALHAEARAYRKARRQWRWKLSPLNVLTWTLGPVGCFAVWLGLIALIWGDRPL